MPISNRRGDEERGTEMADPSAPGTTTGSRGLTGTETTTMNRFQGRMRDLRRSMRHTGSAVWTCTIVGGTVLAVLGAIGGVSYGFVKMSQDIHERRDRKAEQKQKELEAFYESLRAEGRSQCQSSILNSQAHPQTVTEIVTVTTGEPTASATLLARCLTEDGTKCEDGEEAAALLRALMDHGMGVDEAISTIGDMLDSLESAAQATTSPVATAA